MSRPRRRVWPNHGLFALGIGVTSLALPGRAEAFRCTQVSGLNATENGPSLSWPKRQIPFTLHPMGSEFLDRDATLTVLRKAFAVWETLAMAEDATKLCGNDGRQTDIQFIEREGDPDNSWVGFNFLAPQTNTNLLVFRDDVWPPQDPGATDIIALSTLTYSALTGEIIDADIEFNSANFGFSTSDPNNKQMDLLGTAVHEIGHFLGLAHCAEGVPCGNNEVMESTANYGEVAKRLLKCDDRTAITFKYPKGASNGYAVGTLASTSRSLGGGTCVPPQVMTQTPRVQQLSRAQGRGCSQANAALPLGLVLGALRGRGSRRGKGSQRGGRQSGRRWLWLGLGLAAAAISTGCGDINACGGHTGTIDPNGPLITSMRLIGQVDIDPWRAVIEANFIDADGDLGMGTVDYFVNGDPNAAQTQQLARVFGASGGIAEDTTQAKVQLLLRFDQKTASHAYLHLGTQITDAAGHKSNCYALNLSYLLTAMTEALPTGR